MASGDSTQQAATQLEQLRKELEERLASLRERTSGNRITTAVPVVAGVLSLGLTALTMRLAYGPKVLTAPAAFAIAVSIVLLTLIAFAYGIRSTGSLDLQLGDVQQDLDLLSYYHASQEHRAEKLFRLHQAELKKYYDIMRSQSAQIFYVGLAAIGLGAGIIVVALVLATQPQNAELSGRIAIAALGAVGSIMTNFVGVIFLRMYSSTVKSLAAFHSRLVGTHHLHYGSLLVAKIDDQSLRESTLAEMAKLASWGHISPGTTDADGTVQVAQDRRRRRAILPAVRNGQ